MSWITTITKALRAQTVNPITKPKTPLSAIAKSFSNPLSSRSPPSRRAMSSANSFATFKDWRDHTTAFNANQPYRPKFPINNNLPTLVLALTQNHTPAEYNTVKSAVDQVCKETQATVGKLSYLRWMWEDKITMCKSNSQPAYHVIYFSALGGKLDEVMARVKAVPGLQAVGVSRSSLGCEGVNEDTPLALAETVDVMRATEASEKVRAEMGRV